MPAYGWGGDVGLERWLFDEPYAFDFFQAVHLLELWSKAARSPRPERITEAVRFRASFDLSFPPSAIRKLRPGTAGAPAEMTVAFSSLGGIAGPLPTSFTEEILRRLSEHDSAAAAFLDIFHHRLISLLYRIRSGGTALAAGARAHANRPLPVFADRHRPRFAGAGDRPAALRYAGLLASAPVGHRPRRLLRLFRGAGQRQFVGEWSWLADQMTHRAQAGTAR